MGFVESKVRNLFIFSTICSAIGIVVSVYSKLTKVSILLSAILFLVNLFLLWITQYHTRSGKAVLRGMQKANFVQVGFLLYTSAFSSGLGFISWIFLFEPDSLVRGILVELSPILGWGIGVALYLLAVSGAILNEGGEKKDGLLIATVLFSVIGHLFLFWMSAQIFSYTIDDAFITFRYSKNLAGGFGPTYNPGQPAVEGYTTFMWMLLMTLPHLAGVNVVTFSKVVGILLTSATLPLISLLAFTLTRKFSLKARLFFGSFAAYLLAMLPITSIHAIAGMETTLFIFLIGLMVYMVIIGLQDGSRLLFWSPFLGLAIGMTRPEGNVISLLLLACGWLFSTSAIRKKLILYSLWLYVLPGALYFLWRFLYYDLILPLPFYMKILHGGGLGGATEVGTYLLYLLPSISVFLLAGILRLRKEHYALLIPIIFLLLFYLFPVHAMGFNWRFIFPATPFISILVAIGGITIFELLRGAFQSRKPWEPILLAGLFLVGLGNLDGLDGIIKNKNFYGAGISNYKTFGTLLSEYNNKHELTLAIGDAGTVPYYSDWQIIDLFGLNSREVAFGTVPVFALVFEQQPTDLILLSVGANPNRISDEHAGAQRMYEEAIRNGMVRIGTFAFGRVNNIWVIGYPESELAVFLNNNMDFIAQP